MKWSFKLGRALGIDVYVHVTFLMLLAWIATSHGMREGSLAAAARATLFTMAVFGTVILHELGHALTARRFGIRTRDITLLPIGGVARLERLPEKPREELLVALAGPAVNVAIAATLFTVIAIGGGRALPVGPDLVTGGPFLANLAWVNVTLAIFNLIPAFPMDGGRVLRAVLAMRRSYVDATRSAARLGQAIALVLGVLGLFLNPFLAFVALFVWIGAASEAAAVQAHAALAGMPVGATMVTDFRVLSPGDSLGEAATRLLSGSQVDFPVVGDDGRLLGVLTRTNLLSGLTEEGAAATVGAVMSRRFETTEPNEMLESALSRLETCACRSMPVLRGGQVVGIVTLDHVAELLMVKEALGGKRGDRQGMNTRPAAASA